MSDVREDSSAPSHGDNHPAALAVHATNNAIQIAMTLRHYGDATDPLEQAVVEAIGRRIEELLSRVPVHVAALHELLQRQERTIEEQNVALIRERQYATRVETKNSELVQSVITLTSQLDDAHAVLVAHSEIVQ